MEGKNTNGENGATKRLAVKPKTNKTDKKRDDDTDTSTEMTVEERK